MGIESQLNLDRLGRAIYDHLPQESDARRITGKSRIVRISDTGSGQPRRGLYYSETEPLRDIIGVGSEYVGVALEKIRGLYQLQEQQIQHLLLTSVEPFELFVGDASYETTKTYVRHIAQALLERRSIYTGKKPTVCLVEPQPGIVQRFNAAYDQFELRFVPATRYHEMLDVNLSGPGR